MAYVPEYLTAQCDADEKVCYRCYRIRKSKMMKVAPDGDIVCLICVADGRGNDLSVEGA